MDASYSRDCHSDSILHAKISGHIMESEEETKRGQVFNDDFKQVKTEDSEFLIDVLLTGHANQAGRQRDGQRQTDRQTGRHIH